MPMLTVKLTEVQQRKLRAIAAKRGMSMSDLVRALIDRPELALNAQESGQAKALLGVTRDPSIVEAQRARDVVLNRMTKPRG